MSRPKWVGNLADVRWFSISDFLLKAVPWNLKDFVKNSIVESLEDCVFLSKEFRCNYIAETVEWVRRNSIGYWGVPKYVHWISIAYWDFRFRHPDLLSLSFERISYSFLRRISVEIYSIFSSSFDGRLSFIFYSTLAIFYNRMCSFLGGRIAFNILAVLGWTYFVFAVALHRAPQVPPELAAFMGTGMAQASKEADSNRKSSWPYAAGLKYIGPRA